MNKRASTLSNMVLTLLLITFIAGGSLGFIYQLTADSIYEASLSRQKEAVELVVPGFDNDPASEMFTLESSEGFELKVFPAKMDGELIGVAVETMSNRGFNGEIKVMVGMTPDGTILNYEILEHRETPGLGTKMHDWFKSSGDEDSDKEASRLRRFFDSLFGITLTDGEDNASIIGKNPGSSKLLAKQDGGDVDAITAATITTRAFLHAIEVAYTTYTQKADASSSATIQNNDQEGGKQDESME